MTAAEATAIRTPTRAKTADVAAVDVLVGGADGANGFKRLDVAIRGTAGGGLHVDIEVPAPLAGSVGNLLAALGVKGQR